MRDDQAPLVCSVPGCGAKLRRNNTIGRCQEHRYIPASRDVLCAADGCGKPLRKDNSTGYCDAHKYATARAPVRICAADGCENKLRADNKSGYCAAHAWQTATTREYREQYYAELREQSEQRRQQRPECSVDGCEKQIRSDNTSGRCAAHIYIPLDLPVCAVDGCENRLNSRNPVGRCMEHRGLYWAADAPKCAVPGCGKTLRADNQTGVCRQHRSGSEWRKAYNREYYRRNQAALREYARQYREVYGEEHRAYTRAWNAANPEARQAMHARRRQLARHRQLPWQYQAAWYRQIIQRRRQLRVSMDATDRLLSGEYRRAIRHDRCFYCGSPDTDHVDHFFPLAKGGTDHFFNLVRACRKCNLSKNTMCGTAFLLRGRL